MRSRVVHIDDHRELQNRARTPQSSKLFGLLTIDQRCVIHTIFTNGATSREVDQLCNADRTRLRPDLEPLVAAAMRVPQDNGRRDPISIRLVDGAAVRVTLLRSANEPLAGLVIEGDAAGDRISGAAVRFGLTPRQIDVLLLALDGANAGEIARVLHISEYTAQGYVKSLLLKTGSRNRAAMVAKVLDWEALPPAG